MRVLWLVVAACLLIGCSGNSSPVARMAGSYPGQFQIESVGESTDRATIAKEALKGTLALYATKQKFKLEMANANQQFTISGKWSAAKDRVTMVADNFEFKNPTEEDQKAFDMRIITPEEIRTAFAHEVVLDGSLDRRRLTGLKMSFGRIIGRLDFNRPIPQ